MFSRKFRIALCISIFSFALFLVWNNILVLDGYHSSDDSIVEADTDFLLAESEVSLDDNSGISEDNKPAVPEDNKSGTPEKQQDNSASPQPAPVRKGYHIHINLDEVRMYVYKGEELLKTYPVSGGKPSTPSPEGTWRIIHKDTWGEGFGGAWMGFNVPWGT